MIDNILNQIPLRYLSKQFINALPIKYGEFRALFDEEVPECDFNIEGYIIFMLNDRVRFVDKFIFEENYISEFDYLHTKN